jgi:hypothetical protein
MREGHRKTLTAEAVTLNRFRTDALCVLILNTEKKRQAHGA